MSRKNLPLLREITIESIAAEGKAVAHVDGQVVFVPYCVPGDVADLQVTRKKHSFMEARVERVVKPSDKRCEAVCKHYGVCGGCKWQILPYSEQLRWKQQQVTDNLVRIGKVELPEIEPILGSEAVYGYRNKLEFTFADHKWLTAEQMREKVPFEPGLGFHIPNCFDKVLDIEECHLMPEVNNRLRNRVRTYAIAEGMTFYNEHTHEGMLRTLIVRMNDAGEVMVVVVFGEDMNEKSRGLMAMIQSEFEEVVSLWYCVNKKMNDTIGDQELVLYAGKDHLIETMEELRFKIRPKSFYQTNTRQALRLYEVAREFAGLKGKETVYDLYTGTGTIAQFVARQARQVIGIEYVEDAIEDARLNAQMNGIDNVRFFAGDMKDILTREFISEQGQPDVVITDPPRAGMHEDVVKVLLEAAPKRIVYVSCNPATQARDVNLLAADYAVRRVQPVDMFPQTQHVENVVLMERENA
ncbi:MAG: 23S rRNA (uracil(1939)-C(5))-methyltransferase RlmD [Paludibacteraceae bacterium]|nr:23S rRNA (uracil(1939)-C(5))-methyltransferase RlmD [Paludibacteraceae bacterium]